MIRPLSDVRNQYIPQAGADRNRRTFVFAGFIAAEKKLMEQSSAMIP